MAHKRRLKDVVEGTNRNYIVEKRLRDRLHQGMELSMDAGLQSLNDDISSIIINLLKLFMTDLVALSSTCSRWRNKINAFLDKDLQHYLPLSHGKYKVKRNGLLASFYLIPKSIRDVQIFEFGEVPTRPDDLEILSIPWTPHIIFIKSYTGFAIFDLKQQKVIRSFDPMPSAAENNEMYRLYATNIQRKQVVITTTEPIKGSNIENNTEYDECFWTAPLHEWLHVYNVDDTGSVEFVTKFCVDNDYAMAFEQIIPYTPSQIYLDKLFIDDNIGDGMIWHAVCTSLRKFSIDENKEVELGFDLDHNASVLGIGEYNGRIILFVFYEQQNTIKVFDTSSKNFLGELQNLDLEMHMQYSEFEQKIIVRNNLAIMIDYNMGRILSIYNLDNYERIDPLVGLKFLSPDNSRLGYAHFSTPDSIYELIEGQCTYKLVTHWKPNNLCRFFRWIGNNRILQLENDLLSITTVDGGTDSFKLPDFGCIRWGLLPRVTVIDNVVYIAEIIDRRKKNIGIYRLIV